jgi:hypothetical protein
MSNLSDYNDMLETILSIDDRDVRSINVPVDTFIQEGEDLLAWCRTDEDVLVSKGLDRSVTGKLAIALGALREAQVRLNLQLHFKNRIMQECGEQLTAAIKLRKDLLHDFRYAYRMHPDLMEIINRISSGKRYADIIQDLNDLSVLGKNNPQPLEAIRFDTSRFELAEQLSAGLPELLAEANNDRKDPGQAKMIRDKAYTLCKILTNDIRVCGRYAFWQNPDRLKGYASAYFRRKNLHQRSQTGKNNKKIT